MAEHNEFGRLGEEIAAQFLLRQGYIIRELNWRLNKLEIDIVAEHNDRIVIVEVKTRKSDFVDPLRAIDKAKQRRMVNAGKGYMEHYKIEKGLQFDVIIIVGTPDKYEIEHIPDAFYPALRTYR